MLLYNVGTQYWPETILLVWNVVDNTYITRTDPCYAEKAFVKQQFVNGKQQIQIIMIYNSHYMIKYSFNLGSTITDVNV